MYITATELKVNLGKYLEMASTTDVFITKNGKNIARLTSPSVNKTAILDSLVGIIPNGVISEEELKEERLSKK